jgi:hypothetical protein
LNLTKPIVGKSKVSPAKCFSFEADKNKTKILSSLEKTIEKSKVDLRLKPDKIQKNKSSSSFSR